MERHICVWHKEGVKEKAEVGELIIEGNKIEFYSRFHGEIFPSTYIGGDGNVGYKVFVNGSAKHSNRKTLDYSSAHKVFYVLMQNFDFSKGLEIAGIKEFSFEIPELIKWIGIRTVSYASTEQGDIGAMELQFPTIVLKESSPHIEIHMESKTFNSTVIENENTAITLKNVPRISVEYEDVQNIQTIISDIECIMQFFGLLIGTVSNVEDIRLSVEGQNGKSWLYINHDFSYNLHTKDFSDKPRTYYYVLEENIVNYYDAWRNFYEDDTYSLLRRIYFAANSRKDILAEEIFIEYMRFLDGYHTRISGDEEAKKRIKDSLKDATKRIKSLLFTSEGKALFEEAMIKADPSWRCNSSHMNEIAGWIAAGYLGKTQLSYRLQELDKMFFSIISKNANDVEKNTRDSSKYKDKSDEELIQIYFKDLGDTRNYYSHYKLDKSGVLEIQQLCTSIDVLKATIISILLSHMGIDRDLIRRILEFDSELHWQTMCLRCEGEKPFDHPSQIDNKP